MKFIRILKAKKMKYWEAAEEMADKIYEQNLKKQGFDEDFIALEWHEYNFINRQKDVQLDVWFDLGDYYNGLANQVTFILYVKNKNTGKYKRLKKYYKTTLEGALTFKNIINTLKNINNYNED